MKSSPTPLVHTVPQAAAAWQVTPQHIYNLIRRGEIQTVLIGASRRIPNAEIERLAGIKGGAR